MNVNKEINSSGDALLKKIEERVWTEKHWHTLIVHMAWAWVKSADESALTLELFKNYYQDFIFLEKTVLAKPPYTTLESLVWGTRNLSLAQFAFLKAKGDQKSVNLNNLLDILTAAEAFVEAFDLQKIEDQKSQAEKTFPFPGTSSFVPDDLSIITIICNNLCRTFISY